MLLVLPPADSMILIASVPVGGTPPKKQLTRFMLAQLLISTPFPVPVSPPTFWVSKYTPVTVTERVLFTPAPVPVVESIESNGLFPVACSIAPPLMKTVPDAPLTTIPPALKLAVPTAALTQLFVQPITPAESICTVLALLRP